MDPELKMLFSRKKTSLVKIIWIFLPVQKKEEWQKNPNKKQQPRQAYRIKCSKTEETGEEKSTVPWPCFANAYLSSPWLIKSFSNFVWWPIASLMETPFTANPKRSPVSVNPRVRKLPLALALASKSDVSFIKPFTWLMCFSANWTACLLFSARCSNFFFPT